MELHDYLPILVLLVVLCVTSLPLLAFRRGES